jgi:hypothetical protein
MMVPYYAWSNRGVGPMKVWLSRGEDKIKSSLSAGQTKATASYVCVFDSIDALNDGLEPANSFDTSIPRFTWWDHKGTDEWVEYEFGASTKITGVQVYWFDEKGTADCKVPQQWKLLYQNSEGKWQPVRTKDVFGTEIDKYNTVRFEPVTTSALRLEATLQSGFSGGILEWKISK